MSDSLDGSRPRTSKTPFCRNKGPAGEECALYRGHYGNHKSKHLATEWPVASDEREQA